MITVDTNVIAYLLLPGDRTAAAEAALARDPDWIAPPLWHSELLNILCLYARKALIELDQAVEVYEQAMSIVADAGTTPLVREAIELSIASGCSGYDCQFIAAARENGVRLITCDQQLLAAFPGDTVSLETFAAGAP